MQLKALSLRGYSLLIQYYNTNMNNHPIFFLSTRYPQLLLPIQEGMRNTEEYKNAVLCGEPLSGEPDFRTTPEDTLTVENTPAGPAEVLYLADRGDFEHALRALAYRCEPTEILPSVGASTIRGLINWEKIRQHKTAYLCSGGTDWNAEFKRFTADKTNYLDTLLLLSRGEYSAVPAAELGIVPEDWIAASLTIRKYHELTHFVCRKLRPENIDAVRDEIQADMIGLLAAFGHYDTALARRFLGIDTDVCRPGGRLSHYTTPEELPDAAARAHALIDDYARRIEPLPKDDVFSLLLQTLT